MLELNDLTVSYGETIAVENVSFTISNGEILALIGPNGVGKTTLIRAVSGVVPIQSGNIKFDGADLLAMTISARAKVLSVVPQVKQMGGAFSVYQAVMMGRTPHMSWLGHPGEEDKNAVAQALKHANLLEFAERQIASLSGGEQQRVLLARSLAQDTPVLLLDEPTNHLDLQHQSNLLSLVKKLVGEKHLTVLMPIHDLNLVALFADKVALLINGKLHAIGNPAEVMKEEIICEAYQTTVEVMSHPKTGTPIIFPTIQE